MEYQNNLEYNKYFSGLKECYENFGDLLKLPILPVYETIVANYNYGNILDFGAGNDKLLFSFIKDKIKDGKYYSLDNDPSGSFDFSDLAQIPEGLKFDLIAANQVFEHLDVPTTVGVLSKLKNCLTNNGQLIITVPNIQHPNRQISNIFHITPWGYNSLYSVLSFCGFKVLQIGRYGKRYPRGPIEKILARVVSRIYRMDYCDSIIVICQKNENKKD